MTVSTIYIRILFILSTVVSAIPALAENDITHEVGITAIALSASDSRIKNDETASADFWLYWQRPHGRWTLYVEGNTTPRAEGVSTLLGESNADAGTALDEARRGRVQLSALFYTHEWDTAHILALGMIDASAYLDVSRIANDENTQFLGVSFVNNPTIEFPDYSLGAAYEQRLEVAGMPVVRMVLTSSNGLADNPNVSYNQLLNVDDASKGVFAALRAGWKSSNALINFGVWTHTAPHYALDDPAKNDLRNYGAYLVAGILHERHALNFRFGAANPEVSKASSFAGVSYRFKNDPWVVGLGYALIRKSSHVTAALSDDTQHSEAYLRYQLAKGRFLTGSVQHIVNSNFDASSLLYDSRINVFGLRWTELW